MVTFEEFFKAMLYIKLVDNIQLSKYTIISKTLNQKDWPKLKLNNKQRALLAIRFFVFFAILFILKKYVILNFILKIFLACQASNFYTLNFLS